MNKISNCLLDKPELLLLYQQILQTEVLVDHSNSEQQELLDLGLIVQQGNKLEVHNQIYRQKFNLNWVQQHPPQSALQNPEPPTSSQTEEPENTESPTTPDQQNQTPNIDSKTIELFSKITGNTGKLLIAGGNLCFSIFAFKMISIILGYFLLFIELILLIILFHPAKDRIILKIIELKRRLKNIFKAYARSILIALAVIIALIFLWNVYLGFFGKISSNPSIGKCHKEV
ncbi:MAG: hypothetical protein HC930_04090 [Hydrococcus sp. SU_1_0]|nr:hypothetical protein [Hydrococcus sp. SU_1_0]